jgi:vacuolar-type H+-ATPase subunit H
MPFGLIQHLEEGERLLALINSELDEELISAVSEWSTKLYQLVEEGAEENSQEQLEQARMLNNQIIQKITEVREELAKEIISAKKGSAAIKAYHGK